MRDLCYFLADSDVQAVCRHVHMDKTMTLAGGRSNDWIPKASMYSSSVHELQADVARGAKDQSMR